MIRFRENFKSELILGPKMNLLTHFKHDMNFFLKLKIITNFRKIEWAYLRKVQKC